MENTKKVLNNIIYLLKLILYFDTKKVVYKSYLVGGGNNNQSNKSESQSNNQKENNSEIDENEADGQKTVDEYLNFVYNLIMNILKDIGAYLSVIPAYILFASVVPIIPFFVAMGGMYAVLKYAMFKFRKL